jgi:hypothetical protein
MVNRTSGIYLESFGLTQATVENPELEECPGALTMIPSHVDTFPHMLTGIVSKAESSLFTAADGSQPKVGIWSKNVTDMFLAINGISYNTNTTIPTIVRLDIDYAEGKPEMRTLRKDLSLKGRCLTPKLEKLQSKGKTWIARSKPIVYDLPEAVVYSARELLQSDEEMFTDDLVSVGGFMEGEFEGTAP